MINLGSISDQTLGGVVTTATHGTGIAYPVLSMHVRALVLLLADGSRVRCSRQEREELFMASICGLGSTGLILEITLDVEPAFRLREVQETHTFDDALRIMDTLVHSSQHVRFWWFPQAGLVRASSFDRTHEVRTAAPASSSRGPVSVYVRPTTDLTVSQRRKPVGTWLWHSLVGYHFLQFLLFLGRFVPALNVWYGYIATWLISGRTVGVDESYRVFNLDCKVSPDRPSARSRGVSNITLSHP